jgi:perosamine synthetase
MNNYNIPVYKPSLGEQEKKNVMECLDSTWISSKGKFITEFEQGFANYIGVDHATSVNLYRICKCYYVYRRHTCVR